MVQDKLTAPNPANCCPHVAARTPASFKARTWMRNNQGYVTNWNICRNSRWSTYPQSTLILLKTAIQWTHSSADVHRYMIYIYPELPESYDPKTNYEPLKLLDQQHFQTKDSHHILHTHNQTLMKYSYTSYSLDIEHQICLMQFIQNRKRQLLPAR